MRRAGHRDASHFMVGAMRIKDASRGRRALDADAREVPFRERFASSPVLELRRP